MPIPTQENGPSTFEPRDFALKDSSRTCRRIHSVVWRERRALKTTRVALVALVIFSLLPALQGVATLPPECVAGECDPDPTPPPRPPASCGSYCASDLVTAQISGHVLNSRGEGIAGAFLYWTFGEVQTAVGGNFSIRVRGDAPVTLTAWHSSYAWLSKELPQPLVDQALPQVFSLAYLLNTRAVPLGINPDVQPSVTIQATTTAPTTG